MYHIKVNFNEFVPFFNENFLKMRKNFHFFYILLSLTKQKWRWKNKKQKGEDLKKLCKRVLLLKIMQLLLFCLCYRMNLNCDFAVKVYYGIAIEFLYFRLYAMIRANLVILYKLWRFAILLSLFSWNLLLSSKLTGYLRLI